MDFDCTCDLGVTDTNHNSALTYSDHVDKYIKEKLAFKAILSPFTDPPFPLYFSPFLTREKTNSKNRRTIIDLSWPKGQSVNVGVETIGI